jgi:LPS export ABC transporter protein LptC/lipopolysaccharide transport protein LptA
MRKVAFISLALVWCVAVALWPRSVNDAQPEEAGPMEGTSEEGLYRASLTEAPFGLLAMNFFETSEGKKRWNIRSKFAEMHRKDNYAFMKQVDADFFGSKTGNVIQTQSDYGRSRLDKQIVELEGKVTIRSRRGYLFEMDKVNYEGSSHGFSTEDAVRMRGPSISHPAMYLRGTGMIGNIDDEHFSLKRNVTAQRQLKSADWLRISSKSGEFYTEEQRATFAGQVHSILPKAVIDSDTFELTLGGDKEAIKARGNVVLKQKKSIGHAANAYMEVGSSQIILEGNARVNSKDNEIRGERIRLFSDDDRIEVEKAEGQVRQ